MPREPPILQASQPPMLRIGLCTARGLAHMRTHVYCLGLSATATIPPAVAAANTAAYNADQLHNYSNS